MQLEESTFPLLLTLTLFHLSRGDLEHSCVQSQHNTQYTGVCVLHLVEYVVSSCIPTYQNRLVNTVRPSGVFIDVDEANSLLTYPFGSYQSGLPCECCVNRCTVAELEQYCEPLQKKYPARRRRRSAQKRQNKHFQHEDIEKVYNSINATVTLSQSNPAVSQISIEKFEQLSQIKSWKLKNIENKLLAKFGVDAKDGLRISVNSASPQSKVTSIEVAAQASKPKVFTDVNKESQISAHHHRHKYLGRRDGMA